MRRHVPLILLAVLACACTSDRELVSDSLASRHWHMGRWVALCCAKPGTAADGGAICLAPKTPAPAGCPEFGAAVDRQLDLTKLANETQVLGRLPADARAKVKAAGKAVETTEKAVPDGE